jgi:hypothetical protein
MAATPIATIHPTMPGMIAAAPMRPRMRLAPMIPPITMPATMM